MEPEGKMGFPPGVAEQMVYQHFKKFKDIHEYRNPPDPKLEEKWKKYEEEKKKAKLQPKTETVEPKTEEIKVEPQPAEKHKVQNV